MPSVTGVMFPSVVRVSAKMKSLHANRKANSPTVISEFRLIGTTMDKNARTSRPHRPGPPRRSRAALRA